MSETVKQEEKAILSLRVAQLLMSKGYKLIRLENSHRFRGKLAFIFEYSEGIDEELARIGRQRQRDN